VNRSALAVGLMVMACSTRSASRPGTAPEATRFDRDRTIRVLVAVDSAQVSATRDFTAYGGDGGPVVGQGRAGEIWRVGATSDGHVSRQGPTGSAMLGRGFVLRVADGGFVTVNGKRYRGDLYVGADGPSSAIVVNRVPLEEYLRSVVAAEMGSRPRGDSSALQAQAIASRSYAYVRLGSRAGFDIRATVADQVYRGADGENAEASAAVSATRGLVLRHQGRVVDAMYFSTCGGSTAEPTEVYRSGSVAYLQRVSDRIGNTARYYCDVAPRFRWTRSLSQSEIQAGLDQYLKAYASVPASGPGRARHVAVVSHTPSGRVGTLGIETDRGAFSLRGNEIRYVLRPPGSEILSSTYFSVEPEYGRDGLITRVTFRGRGYGHGVGMCQWGAIGRARAGQSFRSILGTYYPGTTVGVPPVQ
jgi:stage II sporulation protein D